MQEMASSERAAVAGQSGEGGSVRRLARDAKLVVSTAFVTSLLWLTIGGLWLSALKQERGTAAPAETLPVSDTGAASDPGIDAGLTPEGSGASAGANMGGFIVPVAGIERTQLINSYADSRGEGTRQHEGIDIAAPAGTPVVAARGGRVAKLHESEQGGRTIYIRSLDGTRIDYYAHLDTYARGLQEGSRVRPAQMLGTVGSTGNADPTAPHLHFEVHRTAPDTPWWQGQPVNPYPLMTGATRR